MEVYRAPLRILRGLLWDLRDGDKNVWTALTKRRKSDRRDQMRLREFKDLAARIYHLLLKFDASQDEAIQALNNAKNEHSERWHLPKLGRLTYHILTEPERPKLPYEGMEQQMVTMLSRFIGSPFGDKFTNDDRVLRTACIEAVASYFFSGCMREMLFMNRQ
jgi:hypothetical protein